MNNFFHEVIHELELRHGDVVTLETCKERELLKEILQESINGKIGKKSKILQRRIAKNKPQTIEESQNVSFGLFDEIYNSDEFLLQHSTDALQLVKKGFQKGASYNAPGNIGSAFNEVVSNEGVMVLHKKYMSVEELALVLFSRMRNTALGKQQKDQARDGIDIPDEISRYDQDLYINCFLCARSAYKKYNRSKIGASILNRKYKVKVFGGSTNDLNELAENIISADNCYIYDTELGHIIRVPRLKLYLWALSAGGGTNSGDTVILSILDNGDILYDGWSDKKSLTDIQANGTLINDFSNYMKFICDFYESEHAVIDNFSDASRIITRYKAEVNEMEEQYKNAAIGEAKYFQSFDIKRKEIFAIWMDIQEAFYQRNGTSNHVDDSKKADGFNGSCNLNYLDYLLEHGAFKSTTRCKVINRMAIMERLWLRYKKQQIPFELDTNGIISIAREIVMMKHSECIEELNSCNMIYHGMDVSLGKLLTTLDTVDMLQLAKINPPKNKVDFDQYLKRNTHLIMGGVTISPELIKKSLNITDITSFVLDSEIISKERIMYDNNNKYVTGKKIELYIKYKDGNIRSIGHKTYRSKEGFSGKTTNTMQWSTDIVKIFKESQ